MRSCFKAFAALWIGLVALVTSADAQQFDVREGSTFWQHSQLQWYQLGCNLHTSMRPLRADELRAADCSAPGLYWPYLNTKRTDPSWFRSRVLDNTLVNIRHNDEFTLLATPIFDGGAGRDVANDDNFYTNSRGVRVWGTIGDRFSYQTEFIETQGTFPGYLNQFIRRTRAVPGMGRAKRFGNGWDYQFAAGKISYSPSKFFNLQFGSDKHFIGEGYRSLILSDNAANYPFLKLTTTVWKLKYTNIFAQFREMSLPKDPNLGFPRKYASMHHMSWNATDRLNLGFFEAILWEHADSGSTRGLEMEYLNPVIFLRPSEFYTGSADNALIGLNASYKVANGQLVYGQLIVDEFKLDEIRAGRGWWANKQGFQLGYKGHYAHKLWRLSALAEFNYVRPFTYTHREVNQSYGHAYQPLAHPLGANFWETVTVITARHKRWFGSAQFNYASMGKDSTTANMGSNIFLPYGTRSRDYSYFVGTGVATSLVFAEGRIGYVINPNWDWTVELSATNRTQSSDASTDRNTMVFLTLRAGMPRRYYDF